MNYENASDEILELVGGANNVRSLVHCATRLRFELADESLANDERLEELPFVLKVVRGGGQHQVVVGPAVADYYAALTPKLSREPSSKARTHTGGNPWKRTGNVILKVISGSFSPLIPLMAGSGMIKALLALLTTVGWLSADSGTYLTLNAAGNAVFYFLPALLGYTISKQLGASPFVGAGIGLALLEPSFTSLIGVKGTSFIGIDLQAVNYASTVFPIFIAIVIYTFLERGLNRLIPKDLQYFLTPMLCLLIMVPFTALLFGPIGNNVGDAVATGVQWLFDVSGILAGLLLGAAYPFLTILGLHWGFTPITLQNLTSHNGDVIEGAAVCAVYAQIGIALGAWLRARRGSRIRDVAGPTLLTGILAGVTEPILYGLIMNYRRLLVVVAIAGALGGAWNGLMHVTMDAYVFHNLFSILTLSYSPMVPFIVGVCISLTVGLTLTYFWGIRHEVDAIVPPHNPGQVAPLRSHHEVRVMSPIGGTAIPLSNSPDPAFADGSLGDGIAIIPDSNTLYAPFDGTVVAAFPTGHAIGIVNDDGIEILIHVGIGTVALGGKHFQLKIDQGQRVKAGDVLVEFDSSAIREAGYDLTTPIIVTNPELFPTLGMLASGPVAHGDLLFVASPAGAFATDG